MSSSQILPAGRPLPPTPNTFSPIVSVPVVPGTPVARSQTVAGEVQLCSQSAASGKIGLCSGIALTAANPGERALVQYAGTIELTEAEWAAVNSDGGALVEGKAYYVSVTVDGNISTSTFRSGEEPLTPVGIAQSPTVLLLQLGIPVVFG